MGQEGAQFYVVQSDNSELLLELACKSSEAGDCPGPGLMGGLVQLLRTSRDTHQHAERLSRVVSSFQSFCAALAPDSLAGMPSFHADLKSAAVLFMTCRDGQVPWYWWGRPLDPVSNVGLEQHNLGDATQLSGYNPNSREEPRKHLRAPTKYSHPLRIPRGWPSLMTRPF